MKSLANQKPTSAASKTDNASPHLEESSHDQERKKASEFNFLQDQLQSSASGSEENPNSLPKV